MSLQRIIIFSFLAAFIISCKVTQPYTRPADAVNDSLYRGVTAADTNNIAAISWREMFADASLQALIQEGINNNLDLKVAAARIKTANANAIQSRLALLPSLNANASATFQRVPSTQFGFPQAYQLYLNTSWEADIWGKLGSAKRAALAALMQSEAYQRAVQTQLVADIATNYYLLVAYDAQLQITEQTIAYRKEEVETMKTLKESDVVTGAAVVQSAANLYAAQITLADLKQSIRETENAICVLLGRSPGKVARTALQQQAVTTGLATGVPAQLLANRPDVQEAEFQLRGAFEQVNIARTYFYPTLTITGSAGVAGTSLSQLFDLSTFFANLTGGLLQPIFAKGVNKQRLAVAKATEEEYLADFKKSLLVAGQEVSDALFSYKSAKEKDSLRTQQISFLQKSVDYTKELLKYSSATNYTDVLVSEQNLLSAQLSGISDKLQQLTAVVTLYRSLGGGWQ